MSTKGLVLSRLESCKGSFISGEDLAGECGISRNAIWKAVSELRKEGYKITSVNNRGYMLSEDNDIVSEEGIRLHLSETIQDIIVYNEIDSTSMEAKRKLFFENDTFVHGNVIIARKQLSGRGHNGSIFQSPETGIYLSIILDPKKVKTQNRPVTDFIAESVRSVLERSLGISLKIKEKNRLYQGQKKICGIMTEGVSDLETGIFSSYIVGIGIYYSEINHSENISRNQLIASMIESIV